eukprot:NODE_61_length_25240_cov_0.547194.p11 type:complete len:247 gc:universal NODE_61_length_25240_cov_0.547194:17683-16943(-)
MAEIISNSVFMEIFLFSGICILPKDEIIKFLLVSHSIAIYHGMSDMMHLKFKDYGWYISLILCHLVLWQYIPVLALAVFMPLSLIHFGKEDAFIENKSQKYVFKGLMVIAGILYSDRYSNHLFILTGIQLTEYAYFKYIMMLGGSLYCDNSDILVKIKVFLEMLVFCHLDSFYSFSIYYLCSHCYYSTSNEWALLRDRKHILICAFVVILSIWGTLVLQLDLDFFSTYLRYLSCLATPHIIFSLTK